MEEKNNIRGSIVGLVERSNQGDAQATEEICQKFGRYIRKTAKWYASICCGCVDEEDFAQIGYLALLEAIECFRNKQGYNSNYCTAKMYGQIKSSMQGEADKHGFCVALPAKSSTYFVKIAEADRAAEEQNIDSVCVCSYEDRITQISNEIGTSRKSAKEALELRFAFSESDCDTDKTWLWKTFYNPDTSSDPVQHAFVDDLSSRIEEALSTVTVKEEAVLRLRFGMTDGATHTLEEVGKAFGLSQERVRQIEARAFRKLRHPSRSKRLVDYIR